MLRLLTALALLIGIGVAYADMADGPPRGVLTKVLTSSLTTHVALSISSFTDGPVVSQGNTGTWFVSGTATVQDTGVTAANFVCKLWDGTTTIASGSVQTNTAGMSYSIPLSGVIVRPAGNLRISCQTNSSVSPFIQASTALVSVGNASTITAMRIQ